MRIDPSISQSPFTAEEDRAIVRFQANEDKAGKWAELAKSLPGRTRKQIRDRWRNTISKAASEPRQSTPSANAGLSQRKTPTEMATMATAKVVHKKGVPQEKNDVAATKKMNYWTDEEDERLIELVRGFGSGPKKWKQLAAEMPGECYLIFATFRTHAMLIACSCSSIDPYLLIGRGELLLRARILTHPMTTRAHAMDFTIFTKTRTGRQTVPRTVVED